MKRPKRAPKSRGRATDARRRFLKWFGAGTASFVIVANNATALVERLAGWWAPRQAPRHFVMNAEPGAYHIVGHSATLHVTAHTNAVIDAVHVTDRAQVDLT